MPFAESFHKLRNMLREQMIADSHRNANANWQALMREQWGDRFTPPTDDMILVDSPTTTNHYHPEPKPSKAAGAARVALTLALATGLGGGGLAAAAFAIPRLAALLRPTPAPTLPTPAPSQPAPAPTPPDTPPNDLQWDLRLGKP